MINFAVCDFELALDMGVLIRFGGSLRTRCKTSLNDCQLAHFLSCELILGLQLIELVLQFLSECIWIVVCVTHIAPGTHQSFNSSQLGLHLFDFLFKEVLLFFEVVVLLFHIHDFVLAVERSNSRTLFGHLTVEIAGLWPLVGRYLATSIDPSIVLHVRYKIEGTVVLAHLFK